MTVVPYLLAFVVWVACMRFTAWVALALGRDGELDVFSFVMLTVLSGFVAFWVLVVTANDISNDGRLDVMVACVSTVVKP